MSQPIVSTESNNENLYKTFYFTRNVILSVLRDAASELLSYSVINMEISANKPICIKKEEVLHFKALLQSCLSVCLSSWNKSTPNGGFH
jgi:hypothetical protein